MPIRTYEVQDPATPAPGGRAVSTLSPYIDLAPEIVRQRLIIEGVPAFDITDADIERYLTGLGRVTDMVVLTQPVTHRSPLYGWAGWVHWETSGAHFYAWEQPRRFFSVDVYTCKAFVPEAAVQYTRDFFLTRNITCREA